MAKAIYTVGEQTGGRMGGEWHTRTAAGGSSRRRNAQRRRRPWLLVVVSVALCALLSLFIARGVRIHGLRQALVSANEGTTEAMIERQDLERQLALKDDLTAIENAAREQLGWVLPGEERVFFVDPSDTSTREGE